MAGRSWNRTGCDRVDRDIELRQVRSQHAAQMVAHLRAILDVDTAGLVDIDAQQLPFPGPFEIHQRRYAALIQPRGPFPFSPLYVTCGDARSEVGAPLSGAYIPSAG